MVSVSSTAIPPEPAMVASTLLKLERRGRIAIVAIGNPTKTFLTDAVLDELHDATVQLEADQDVRVVIFTGGVPGVFVQHHHINEIIAFAEDLQSSTENFEHDGAMPEMAADAAYRAIEGLSKPTIAAINGNCMGGGLELALCCDFRIAELGPYRIGLVEAQFDCLPGGGGLTRLTRLLGYSRAIGPLLLGSAMSPKRAAEVGIVHSTADEALKAAIELGERFERRSPRALRHIKHLARWAEEVPMAEALRAERRRLFDLWSRKEALDRIKGFSAGAWTLELE
jgi:enoyl-CoA hydratase/carnithine racemase